MRQIPLSFHFGKHIFCVFSTKRLNYTVISSYLQKMSTLNVAKITTSTGTVIMLQTSVKYLRATTVCSAFTRDCRLGSSNIEFIGTVHCPNTMCSAILCVHKITLQSPGRNDYQVAQCTSTCQVRNIPLEEETNLFFLRFGRGVYVFGETQKSIQGVTGDVYCPTCSNEKCI